MAKIEQLLNHVAFVIDDSGSMAGLRSQVEKVVANQIKRLAELDEQTGQETHVSVYIFGDQATCVVYDKDVKRLVGKNVMSGWYDGGMTALIDATILSQKELASTAQLHGDHAFLTFVLTDGDENRSRATPLSLSTMLAAQSDNWTVACLVPNVLCKNQAIRFGFPKDNVMIWDVSAQGLAAAETEVSKVTDTYFHSRASGIRGSKTLFAKDVTQAQVQASGMKEVDPNDFMIVPVALASTSTLAYVIPKKSITRKNPNGIKHVEIMPFIQETGRTYVAGTTFYELVKSEKFEANKQVALIHRQTKKVYRGDQAKALIGLTGTSTRIRPQATKSGDYDIFVQSTSVNRHLPLGSRVLIFK